MSVPILDLQQRIRELGRIRIGQQVPTGKGGTRPEKLETFRLTSASRPLLDKVAALYGGTVQEWTPRGGTQQWEVFTTAKRIPILVPPQPVSQWYELWTGGGCVRRCDGQREIIKEKPCLCALADERACKPTTRLNVVLKDVEGIGVFRLESHGYYAATELPQVASFLEQAGGYVSATLILEARVVKKVDEKPKHFMVPAIEIEGVTPGQLVSGQVIRPQIADGAAPRPVAGSQAPAISAPVEPTPSRDFVKEILAAETPGAVMALFDEAKRVGVRNPAEVTAAAKARGTELTQQAEQQMSPVGHIAAAQAATTMDQLTAALSAAQLKGFGNDMSDNTKDPVALAFKKRHLELASAEAGTTAAPPPPSPQPAQAQPQEREALWSQIVAASPFDRTADLTEDFSSKHHVLPSQASPEQLATYLADLTSSTRAQAISAPAEAPAADFDQPPF